MDYSTLATGKHYAIRIKRRVGDPVLRAELMKKVKPGKWQVKVFHDDGVTDMAIVPSGNFLSEWEDRDAFLEIENKTLRLEEYVAEHWKRSRDYFPAKAVEIVF